MSNLLLPLPAVGTVENHGPYMEDHVDTSASGKETVSTYWLTPRYKYKWKIEALNSLTRLDYQALRAFFVRQQGRLGTFLIVDPEDSVVTDHGFAVGDATTTTFQLQRTVGGSIVDASGYTYNAASKPYTNLIKNSSFETDSNADGLADSWTIYNNSSATEPTTNVIVPGMNGGKAQRVSWGTAATNTKGIFQALATAPVAGQWYTISGFARASGTNIGKFIGHGWTVQPNTITVIAGPALTAQWQRFVVQVFWNVGASPSANLFFTIATIAGGTQANASTGTFGDLDFDLVQFTTGQWGANDLQPVETPAAATGTDTPAYWPALGDGYEPLYDLNGSPTIYQDGDWRGRRQLYPWARTNLVQRSETVDLWTRLNTFISPNSTTAPDGTGNADAVNEGQPPGAPTLNTLTPSTTGGTIATGTVFVKVAALNANSEESLPSGELSTAVTGPTASVAVAWSAPVGGSAPTGYRVYVGTGTGTEGQFFLPGNVTAFTVTTLTGTAGTPKTTTAAQHYVDTPGVPAEVAGELRCWSVFLKANSLPNILLSEPGSGTGIKFNLGTGVIDGNGDGAIVASGVITSPLWPGWYRVWFTRRTGASGTALFVQGCADATYSSAGYTGTGRSFFVWGGQCERTSNLNGPTPYIPTPAAAAVTVTDYTLSSTGVVTPAAVLPAGAFLSADMSFYRRARLANPELSFQRIVNAMYSAGLDLVSTI